MSRPFNSWQEFSARLEQLGLFRMRPGTERIATVLETLGRRRCPVPLAQIVGTNGKGSTCAFLSSLARAHGLRCLTHFSPHFVSARERLRLFSPRGSRDGELLPETFWLEAANTVMRAGGESLTYFELLTAIAACLPEPLQADLVLMESGLGGSFDATTALDADLLIFTPIALDHRQVLGPGLREIAADKAGALRRGVPALSAPQSPEAGEILLAAAAAKACPLSFAPPSLPEEARGGLGLAGAHQEGNAALALAAWRALAPLCRVRARADAEQDGLAEAWIAGRLQFITPAPNQGLPALILDGAHNAHGLAALGHSLAVLGIAPGALIFSCLQDKEPESLFPHLRALAGGPIFVPPVRDNPRAAPPEALAAGIGLSATPARDLPQALDMAMTYFKERLPQEASGRPPAPGQSAHPLLICGSLYLLGEFFTLYPQYLTPEQTDEPATGTSQAAH